MNVNMPKGTLLFAMLSAFGVAHAEADAGAVAGGVNITSQPSGATVILDGVDRGVTPVKIFDLTPGRHHLRYRLAGHVERDRFFKVGEEAGKTLERNEVLAEETGLLLVHAEPDDCSLHVDGVSAGHAPRLLTNLTTKDAHRVRVSKPGFRDQTLTVTFDGRTPVYRKVVLQPDVGTLDLTSEPAGALVSLNGSAQGATPQTVSNVVRGTVTVAFSLLGYETATRELRFGSGERQSVHVTLRPLPGTLRLAAEPDESAFFVNGTPRGKGMVTLTGLTNGVYEIRCEKEGFATETRQVTVGADTPAEVAFRLSDSVGTLEVRTEPPRAEVFLDGKSVGTSAANGVFELPCVPEGEHELRVCAPGYVEANARVKIRTGETARGTMRLKREFIPDIEIVTERGATTGVLVEDGDAAILLEVSPGITRSFPRAEVRSVRRLSGSGAAKP